jgi:hypothetical protein
MRLLDEATIIKAKNAENAEEFLFSPFDQDRQYRCVRCGVDQSEFWRDAHLLAACVQYSSIFPG